MSELNQRPDTSDTTDSKSLLSFYLSYSLMSLQLPCLRSVPFPPDFFLLLDLLSPLLTPETLSGPIVATPTPMSVLSTLLHFHSSEPVTERSFYSLTFLRSEAGRMVPRPVQ